MLRYIYMWWRFTKKAPEGVDKTRLFSSLNKIERDLSRVWEQAVSLALSTSYMRGRTTDDSMRVHGAAEDIAEAIARVRNAVKTLALEIRDENNPNLTDEERYRNNNDTW
jgi:hypothetical protein